MATMRVAVARELAPMKVAQISKPGADFVSTSLWRLPQRRAYEGGLVARNSVSSRSRT